MSEISGQSRQHTGGDLLVRQGRLYSPEGFIDDASVVISAGRIAFAGADRSLPKTLEVPGAGKSVRVTELPVIEARGCIISPGFIDVHMHGGVAAIDGWSFGLQQMAPPTADTAPPHCWPAVTASRRHWRLARMIKEAMSVPEAEWAECKCSSAS